MEPGITLHTDSAVETAPGAQELEGNTDTSKALKHTLPKSP